MLCPSSVSPLVLVSASLLLSVYSPPSFTFGVDMYTSLVYARETFSDSDLSFQMAAILVLFVKFALLPT